MQLLFASIALAAATLFGIAIIESYATTEHVRTVQMQPAKKSDLFSLGRISNQDDLRPTPYPDVH
jgi:hypothetical protein